MGKTRLIAGRETGKEASVALSQGIIKYPLAILPATCYKSTRFQGRVTEVAGHLGSSDTDAKRRVRGHSVLQRSPDTLEVRTAATRAHGSPTPDRYRGRRTPWKFGQEATRGQSRGPDAGYRGRRTPWKFGRLPGRRGVGLMFIKLSLTSSRRAPLSAVACLPGRRGGGLGFKPRGEHEGKEVRHAAAPGAVNGQNTGAVACPRRRRRKATNEAV